MEKIEHENPQHLPPEEYERMIRERDDMIHNLVDMVYAAKIGKFFDSSILYAKLLAERNELDKQLALQKHHFSLIVHKLNKCQDLTKHYTVRVSQMERRERELLEKT